GAARKREIADVANQGNVGVVDGQVQVGLIVEAGGLISGSGTCGFLFLGSVDFVAAGHGKQNGDDSEKDHDRNQSKPSKVRKMPWDFHHFLLDQNLRSLLERWERNFLHDVEWMGGGAQGLGM